MSSFLFCNSGGLLTPPPPPRVSLSLDKEGEIQHQAASASTRETHVTLQGYTKTQKQSARQRSTKRLLRDRKKGGKTGGGEATLKSYGVTSAATAVRTISTIGFGSASFPSVFVYAPAMHPLELDKSEMKCSGSPLSPLRRVGVHVQLICFLRCLTLSDDVVVRLWGRGYAKCT